jgi:hypothetical protein
LSKPFSFSATDVSLTKTLTVTHRSGRNLSTSFRAGGKLLAGTVDGDVNSYFELLDEAFVPVRRVSGIRLALLDDIMSLTDPAGLAPASSGSGNNFTGVRQELSDTVVKTVPRETAENRDSYAGRLQEAGVLIRDTAEKQDSPLRKLLRKILQPLTRFTEEDVPSVKPEQHSRGEQAPVESPPSVPQSPAEESAPGDSAGVASGADQPQHVHAITDLEEIARAVAVAVVESVAKDSVPTE